MNNYPAAFIDDGYTRSVKISGKAGVHPPCEITYRPMAGKEYMNWFAQVFAGADDTDGDILEMMAERIKEWSFPEKITAENLARMNARLFDQMLKIIMGTEAPDGEESDRSLEEQDAGNS